MRSDLRIILYAVTRGDVFVHQSHVSNPTHTLNESHFAVSSKGRFHSARHCTSCSARQTSRPAVGKGWFDPAQPYEEEVCAAADLRSKTARLPKKCAAMHGRKAQFAGDATFNGD